MDGVVPSKPKPATTHTKVTPSAEHHKKTRRSKTLVRKGLKKPSHKAEKTTPTTNLGNDMARLNRAHNTTQSNQISRFSSPAVLKKHIRPLPVMRQGASNKAHINSNSHAQPTHTTPTIQHFEQAIHNAQSHLTEYSEKKTRRFLKSKKMNVVSGSLAVLLLVGFFGYQNAPNLRMRLAATDSGVSSARLPSYKPAGFGIANKIQSEPGKVTVSFKSRTDDRNFTITQSSSNWSSEALSQNQLASKTKQTWQEQGKTVYIYDDTSATWVSGGVLYNIDNKANLSTDQLLRIVNSL